jgi:hypothetical protein
MSQDGFNNPLSDTPPFEVENGSSVASMIVANETTMSAEELQDLTSAFTAADLNGEGILNFDEFFMMQQVMGCDMSPEQCRALMKESKADFAIWLKSSDESHTEHCRKVWDEYDTNNDGSMDLDEINVVSRLECPTAMA